MGRTVQVRVQVSAGGFIKRKAGGHIDFVSPLPCPFNYGEVPGTLAADGDPLDAVVLGPRLARDVLVTTEIFGAIAFVDAGSEDVKLVCSDQPVTPVQRRAVLAWFAGYVLAKRALNGLRGKSGATRSDGWIDAETAAEKVETRRKDD